MPRDIVERCGDIDVNVLARQGAFVKPMRFPFLGLETQRYLVRYRPLKAPRDRPPQSIPIVWTRCHFGGLRPWFRCLCGARVGKLYPAGWLYLCRKCCDLGYQSQNMGRKRRIFTKAARLRRLLGDEGRPGIDPLPARLWGKHRKTHARRCAELEAVEKQLRGPRAFKPRTRREKRH